MAPAHLQVVRPQDPTAPAGYTIAVLVTRYQQEYLSTQARTTQHSMTTIHKHILTAFGPWPLAQVTPDAVRQWRRTLEQTYRPGTVRRYMLGLSGLFRVAIQDLQWIDANPVARAKKPTEPEGRDRYLTPGERDKLLAACQQSRTKQLYLFVVLALATGARKRELLTLRWEYVDFEHGMLRLAHTKNRLRRSVPVTGLGMRLLQEEARSAQDHGLLFPGRRTEPICLDKAFQMAVRRAGLVDFRIHDLRHIFASYCAMNGASLTELAELLGHKQVRQTQRYSHFTNSHLTAVAAKMTAAFLGE